MLVGNPGIFDVAPKHSQGTLGVAFWHSIIDLQSALENFTASLVQDYTVVRAALELPWSNGQTEGQVHRLKLLKRQMYGRAKLDLLRLRVLYSP